MQLYRHNSRILRCTLFAFAIQWLSPGIAAAQTLAPLVIQGGTLIDATGRDPIEDAVIVVEGERIKAVGRRGEVTMPARRKNHRRQRQNHPARFHRRPLPPARFRRRALSPSRHHLLSGRDPERRRVDAGAKARHRLGQDPRPAHLVHRRAAGRTAARLGTARRARLFG